MIGRPDSTEAAPYYTNYINLVKEDASTVFESQLNEYMAFFGQISEEQSLCRYAPGKWSMRQILSHVNDCERLFGFRAFWIARGFSSPLPSFDQETAASAADADRIPWSQHVEEFRRVRLGTISFYKHLPAKAWKLRGIASSKEFSVRSLAYLTAGHLVHHSNVMRERYLQALSAGAG